jgi:hypothetical protein
MSFKVLGSCISYTEFWVFLPLMSCLDLFLTLCYCTRDVSNAASWLLHLHYIPSLCLVAVVRYSSRDTLGLDWFMNELWD